MKVTVGFLAGAVAALLPALAVGISAAQAGPRVAVFPLELNDTSLEGDMGGPRPDEAERIAISTEHLRDELAKLGVEVVDLAPAAEALDRVGPIRRCNGCERRIAEELGADYSVFGVVQKVSNLILNFNIYVRDAHNGEVVAFGTTDIRGNTDEAWRRGVSFIVEERLAGAPLTEREEEAQ